MYYRSLTWLLKIELLNKNPEALVTECALGRSFAPLLATPWQ